MDRIAIVSRDPPQLGFDLRIGRIRLARHLGLRGLVSALEVPGSPAPRELIGEAPPASASGRIPLFLCLCGDPYCGALSVRGRFGERVVSGSDLAFDAPEPSDASSRPARMTRTRPYVFAREAYLSALSVA